MNSKEVSEIALLVSLGISLERAEAMNDNDRTVWIIALRQVRGDEFDWNQFRFVPPAKRERYAS